MPAKVDYLGQPFDKCDATLAQFARQLVDENDQPITVSTTIASFFTPGGRLTTESGVPVSTLDRVNQGTLYYTPAKHNNLYTWSGSAWQSKTFAELSLSLSGIVNGKNYDVFVNSDATQLSLSSAWTNDTTRADAIGFQDGVPVLASDHTKLLLGVIRASGTGVTEDSAGGTVSQVGGKRFVWNAYNQLTRNLSVIDTTPTWNYLTATIRQSHGATGNKVEYVTGFATDVIQARASSCFSVTSSDTPVAGVGIDSTSTFAGLTQGFNASGALFSAIGFYSGAPGLGYHYISWNEKGASSSCTFLGSSSDVQSGLIAETNS